MTRQLSPQQSAVVEFVRTGRGSAFVEAVAGAGKTTTLIEACQSMTGSVAFAAYNKKNSQEIAAKLAELGRSDIRAGTFHSFGFNAWRRVHPHVKLDEKAKSAETLNPLGFNADEFKSDVASVTLKLIGLAKQRAIGLFGNASDESLWYDIVDHFDLANELEDEYAIERVIPMAIQGLEFHRAMADRLIDFDDMIYMPVVSGCRVWQNDWVLVDEAQDTNPARRALARKMLRPNGRAIFVGDRHQAIYGFTGADNDAIDQIIRDFRCASLPLTITYRCPKAVVAEAQKVVSHIEAHETAPEGIVRTIEQVDLIKQSLIARDAILCRKTKPLVETAYSLIRAGVPCHVEGKDIGAGLLKLANKYAARSLEALINKLDAYAERECEKLTAKGRETQAEALMDRVETLKVIAEGCKTVDELKSRILSLFQDSDNEQKPTLTLSTIHKSKGREWPRVFILGENLWMPSPWARQDWQVEQEMNLIYVAYTRAQQELIHVAVPPPAKE